MGFIWCVVSARRSHCKADLLGPTWLHSAACLLQPILLNMVLTCIHEVNAACLPVDCSPVQRDMTFYCLKDGCNAAGVPALFERLGCSRMSVDTTTRGMVVVRAGDSVCTPRLSDCRRGRVR
jgi:hypothetical protein